MARVTHGRIDLYRWRMVAPRVWACVSLPRPVGNACIACCFGRDTGVHANGMHPSQTYTLAACFHVCQTKVEIALAFFDSRSQSNA